MHLHTCHVLRFARKVYGFHNLRLLFSFLGVTPMRADRACVQLTIQWSSNGQRDNRACIQLTSMSRLQFIAAISRSDPSECIQLQISQGKYHWTNRGSRWQYPAGNFTTQRPTDNTKKETTCTDMVIFLVHLIWRKISYKGQWNREKDKGDKGRYR